jgi:hypothetical protein
MDVDCFVMAVKLVFKIVSEWVALQRKLPYIDYPAHRGVTAWRLSKQLPYLDTDLSARTRQQGEIQSSK